MGDGKASRILDAAEALLVSFGYRKVTVDDVARRAGVGKGTVYLYWPSKLELFAAVVSREAAELVRMQLDAARADPAEARLPRLVRRTFADSMCRPLAAGVFTGDYEMLGELLRSSKIGWQFAVGKTDTSEQYLAALYRHGLLADDPATDPMLVYRLNAATTGSFLLEGVPGAADADFEAKADALATTIHRAFEPAAEPGKAALLAAANDLIDLYGRWLDELTGALPGEQE